MPQLPKASDVTNASLYGCDTTQVGCDFDELSSFGSPIDLVATYGAPARRIVVVTAGSGTLNVTTVGVNGTAVNRSATALVAGDFIDCLITTIRTGTNVSLIRVFF